MAVLTTKNLKLKCTLKWGLEKHSDKRFVFCHSEPITLDVPILRFAMRRSELW